MDLESNLVDPFAIDHHRLDAFGDHRLRDILAADARDFYFFTAVDPQVVGQFGRNFNEWFRHQLHIHGIVFCPVVVMLGQAVGRADNRVTVLGCGVFIVRGFESFDHRIVSLLRVQRIVDRALGRFIVFRERTIGEGRERAKDSADTLRIHNEWAHVILRLGINFEVRHVVATNPIPGALPCRRDRWGRAGRPDCPLR